MSKANTESSNFNRDELIANIVASCTSMRIRGIDAIIVIEREQELDEVIDRGVEVDSSVNPELMCSIFQADSRLNQGAVVIRKDRIVAAGCYLPYYNNDTEGDENPYGARHGAARALSENVDAVIIVISAEKDTISVADSGELMTEYDEESLDEFLHNKLSVQKKRARRLNLSIFKNYINKAASNPAQVLVSFIVAVGLWLFVSSSVFPTIELDIRDIVIDVQPSSYMMKNNLQIVSDDFADVVDIRIEGNRSEITDLTNEDFTAALDFGAIRDAGTYSVPIVVSSKDNIKFTMLDTEPLSVTLKVDEIITREFAVKATAPAISLPDDYYVDTVTASPATVMITGSASVLDRIDYVEARSLYEGEINESHETQSQLIIYGANGGRIEDSDLTIAPEKVSVYIPVYKTKELPLKLSLTNYPSNFDVSSLNYDVQPRSIIVAAPDDSIDFLSELDIGTIDISDIRLNQTVTIPIVLPEGYKNLSGNNNARVVWNIADYGKLDFAVTNINVTNVPDNFRVSTITKELMISVIGPSDELSNFAANDFYITANLLGVSLHEGTQDVAVDIRIKGSNRKCWVAGSYKITVNADPKAE